MIPRRKSFRNKLSFLCLNYFLVPKDMFLRRNAFLFRMRTLGGSLSEALPEKRRENMSKKFYGLERQELETSIFEAIHKYGFHEVLGNPEGTVGMQSYEIKEALHILGLGSHKSKNPEKEQSAPLKYPI
jgi:hypothetical protein